MTQMNAEDRAKRELTTKEHEKVEEAKKKAVVLYEGKVVKHHSCGASVAMTFDRSVIPYQSLRRGGITGLRFCGSIRAGELILGEILGDPTPTGKVTLSLKNAITWYQSQIPKRFKPSTENDYVCNHLTNDKGDFMGENRKEFCTELTGKVAALTTEALIRFRTSKK